NRQRSVHLAVESLEGRDVPSGLPVGTLVNQTFSGLTVGTLPLHWSQWSNEGSFAVSNDTALGPTRALSTLGASGQSARTWLNTTQPANVQINTDLFLNAITPAGILARGSSLNGETPSYYAVTASRGLQLQLVRVVNGVSTPLGTIQSPDYISGIWVRVTLYANGNDIRAAIQRLDRNQFLNDRGQWQSTSTWALHTSASGLPNAGLVGLTRSASYQGLVTFDNFQVFGALSPTRVGNLLVGQTFDRAALHTLPVGWSQWSNEGPFGVSTTQPLSTANAGLTIAGPADLVAQTWIDGGLPADLQASVSVFADSLIPAQLFVRGNNLQTARPSYYAVSISRG